MEHRTHGSTATEDAALVSAALDGDREAVAGIYARYADRVHSMCLHMLDDRSEAEDVCGDVFLVAFQRLGQLREPSKLKAWLFASARHEVYKRTRRARRTRLIEEVEGMDRLVNDGALELDGDHEVDQAALAALLRDAAGGLDDRDRLVMELELQGLDGAELADALGTSASLPDCSASQEHSVRAIGATSVQLWWTGSGTSGVVELTPTGEIWSGVLELPASVPGPLEVVAVASAPDALGTGPLASAVVANCPLPG